MSELNRMFRGFCLIFIFVFFIGWIGMVSAGGQGKGQGHGPGWGKGPGWSQGKGKGHGWGHAKTKHAGKKVGQANKVKFANRDKETITKYFSATPFPTTTLPPGIAKNLQRGKPLPPGIQKVFLPSGLVSQLPARPGFEYLAVGKDAVLVDSATGRVADVLPNVLR